MKIYLPNDDLYNKCYVVQNEDVIRAYDVNPQNNISYNYRDYYINSNYIYKDGAGQWNQYTTLPVCLNNDVITDNYYYRNDFDSILIIFLILFIFIFYIPINLIFRFVRRLK